MACVSLPLSLGILVRQQQTSALSQLLPSLLIRFYRPRRHADNAFIRPYERQYSVSISWRPERHTLPTTHPSGLPFWQRNTVAASLSHPLRTPKAPDRIPTSRYTTTTEIQRQQNRTIQTKANTQRMEDKTPRPTGNTPTPRLSRNRDLVWHPPHPGMVNLSLDIDLQVVYIF